MVVKGIGSHGARARKAAGGGGGGAAEMEDTSPKMTKLKERRREEAETLRHGSPVEREESKRPKYNERMLELQAAAEDARRHEPEAPHSGADPAAAPLVAIAPATPGAILPKDLIMANRNRGKPDAPKFLLMLFEILQNESDEVIRWTEDGLALQILDQNNVTEKVLPKYFNHTNFHSFQRQLNYFGFRKWTKSKTDICTFSHPYFRRNQPELMHLIKRKKATRRISVADQLDPAYSPEAFAAATAAAVAAFVPPKKLLPLSPSGKRRLAQDGHETGESRQQNVDYHSANPSVYNGASPNGGSLPVLANSAHLTAASLAPLNPQNSGSQGSTLLPSASTLTNAISPASGGAKKKAKTSSGGKSFNPELAPAGPPPPPSMLVDPAVIAAMGGSTGNGTNGSLPNLDIVRSRLIYRPPQPNGAPSPIPGFPNGFQIPPHMTVHHLSAAMENLPQNVNTSAAPSTPGQSSETNSMFSNSFSDPVDILLRIKKSRAMSQDNTLVQSPQQRSQGQVEGLASLQNFLLSQTLYTNRLESQLKLAVEENETLRHLVDAKQREVESLLNERKMLQNEKAVLTDDKNKLYEINRDLLSKLFPQ